MSTPITKRVRLRSGIALTTALALSAGASVLGAAAASAAPVPPSIDTSGFDNGRYIVVLDEDPMATYRGHLPNLARTAPVGTDDIDVDSAAANAYAAHLETQQSEVAAEIGAQIESSLTVALNGFIADLTAEQAIELTRDARVAHVFPDEIRQIQASPANEFLDLEGLWAQVGGVDEAGQGVVVGVLDTGIAPENPLFAGDPLGTTAGAEPYLAGGQIVYTKGDGNTFTGVCEEGVQFTAADCSTKIVGARYYVDGFSAARIGGPEVGEYLSPRDGDGHGSHTASTAAGNADVPVTSAAGAELGTMSGVAPEARIAAYKVCWTGPNPAVTTDDGCSSSDLVNAINQATIDGVDVINYSIGGGAATTVWTAEDIAFLGAASAGVFVSASAGNSGPGASTLDHAAPWYTTVAAASVPNYEATVLLDNGDRLPGGSVTVPLGEGAEVISGPFVYAGDVPAAGRTAADAALCLPGSLAPVVETIVLCDRGNNARAEKSQVVADAGGIGMVLGNPTPNSIDLDDHVIPTIHIDAEHYPAALAAARTPGATVTFEQGNTSGEETVAPVVAGFSSRGPVQAEGGDILKPDIAAPGVGVIAASANPEGGDPTYALLSGTSMAAPHVAGLAAIYLGERPMASPAEIKSALMTTATDTFNLDGSVSTDPWAQGAGFVNTQSMLDAGLVYQNGMPEWLGYLRGLGHPVPDGWGEGSPIDASDVNIASIGIGSLAGTQTVTRTVTALEPGVYTPTVEGVEGVDVEVSPSTMTFTEAGQTADYTVTFTTEGAALGEWSTGFLTWTSTEHDVRSPIAVQPVAVAAPEWVEGMGTVGETPVTGISGLDGEIAFEANGLAPFTELGNGSGIPEDSIAFQFSIPVGELVHYFSLDAMDDAADLDLSVYRLNAQNQLVEEWVAGTSAGDEQLLLEAPQAANYVAFVDVFSTPGGTETSFTLDHVGVTEGQQEGNFRTEPTSVTGSIAEPFTYTAKWNGLDTNAEYLGVIGYGGTDVQTVVHVTTGDATMPVPERLAGDDRYETAVDVSQQGYPDGAEVVYVASGENFPDGLAAAPAAAHEGGPLLLTSRAALNDVVMEEIERLAPERIVIVGGEPTLTAAVEDALEPLATTVDRVAGADRYETSRLIAAYAFDASESAFMATGRAFPDALTAGSAAGSIGAPVILVDGMAAGVDAATMAELDRLGAQNAYLMGDQASMSNGIELQLDNAGVNVTRFGGSDRFDTAVLVNRAMFGAPVPAMYIASGLKFPDAMAASALAAAQGAPLYLSRATCVDSSVVTESLRLGQPPVYLLGDEQTLSAEVAAYAICP